MELMHIRQKEFNSLRTRERFEFNPPAKGTDRNDFGNNISRSFPFSNQIQLSGPPISKPTRGKLIKKIKTKKWRISLRGTREESRSLGHSSKK